MNDIPRASDASDRSAFVAIDPITQKYHRLLEPGANTLRSLAGTFRPLTYFAISYVWDDWRPSSSELPSWELIRGRLLKLSTTNIFSVSNTTTFPPTPRPSRHDPSADALLCWIDRKCIDQTSASDKAFWVPRMNQVFLDAKRTILLLRGLDLTAVWEMHINTQCMLSASETCAGGRNTLAAAGRGNRNGSGTAGSSHNCIFSPGCLSLRLNMDNEIESLAMSTLQTLWDSPWRKRAWIFQEILLSEQYILSWGEDEGAQIAYMSLEEIGRVVAWLHHRRPTVSWLADFWTWCKQCLILRRFHAADCDMEATIFQLADNLEATIPCDKYYALCGILNLTEVTYSPMDSPDQALDKMVAALTAQGRMGWIYCIPPSVREGIVFSSQHMAPFILTKKKKQAQVTVKCREPFFSNNLFGTTAVAMGKVNNEHSLSSLLAQLQDLKVTMDQIARSISRRPNYLKDSFSAATLMHRRFHNFLFRLGYDMIAPISDPLLLNPLFRALDRSGLNTNLLQSDPECCLWYTILSLCLITPSQVAEIQPTDIRRLVLVSAQSIQGLCRKLSQQNWKILQWQRAHDRSDGVEPSLVAFNGHLPTMGTTLWAVHTKRSSSSILFIASELELSELQLQRATQGINTPSMMGKASRYDLLYGPGEARSEYEDRAHCFYGVAYQIQTSALTNNLDGKYHDSDVEDDPRRKFWRLPGNVVRQTQPQRPVFLTFQRRLSRPTQAPYAGLQSHPSSYSMGYSEASSWTETWPTPTAWQTSETSLPPASEAASVVSWNRPASRARLEFPMLETEAPGIIIPDTHRHVTPTRHPIHRFTTATPASDPARTPDPLSDRQIPSRPVHNPYNQTPSYDITDVPHGIYNADNVAERGRHGGGVPQMSHRHGLSMDPPDFTAELPGTGLPAELPGSNLPENCDTTRRGDVDWHWHAMAQDIPSAEELLVMFPALRLSEVAMVLDKDKDLDRILDACFTLQTAISHRQETTAERYMLG